VDEPENINGIVIFSEAALFNEAVIVTGFPISLKSVELKFKLSVGLISSLSQELKMIDRESRQKKDFNEKLLIFIVEKFIVYETN
jgi:hypothetical protein